MPGIVGLITRMPREVAEQELQRMIEALRHEQFHVTGTWMEESLGVYIGWIARKGSFSDAMPVRNERGDIVLVFSGEEYPEPGTKSGLKARGHDVGSIASSYLVHLSEEDTSFPAGLNGRFQGLLINRSQGTATLFNDRYGMHRLYYHESKHAFYFAAEPKAILAVRPELRRIDSRALGEFIVCGCMLENRSLFDGIQAVPGGSRWIFRNGFLPRKENYFEPHEWERHEPLERETYYQEVRDVFSRNLPRYFGGDERVAMSLTGGLDTRMIMAWQRPEPRSLPCYTFGGALRECKDVMVSRRVARACGQSHQTIPLVDEFFSRFAYFAERAVYLADGCPDVSRAPDVYWNRKAREIAPVRMTGNYGGELLRGIRTIKATEPQPGLFSGDIQPCFREAAQTFMGQLEGNPTSFAVFKQGPWNHSGMLALEESQVSLRSPFWDNELVQTVFRAPLSSLSDNNVSIRLIAEGNKELLRIQTDRGFLGERRLVLGTVERMISEFLFKAEYAYDMGMPQWLAQMDHRFSSLHLERLFLGRHKISHFRVWYRDPLASYLREMLLDSRSLGRPYVDRRTLEGMVNGHLTGKRNYTTEIHKVLTLELLHRLLIDGGCSAPSSRSGFEFHRSGERFDCVQSSLLSRKGIL
jgi:asparagine synthase (glutamine-hydrolysing)